MLASGFGLIYPIEIPPELYFSANSFLTILALADIFIGRTPLHSNAGIANFWTLFNL